MEFSINLISPSATSSSTCGFCRGLVWGFLPRRGMGSLGGTPRRTHLSDMFKARQLGGWLPSHVITLCSGPAANNPSVCAKGTSRY